MTQAEILAEIIDRAWIASGYARRWYMRDLERRGRPFDQARSNGEAESLAFTNRAIRAAALQQLRNMISHRSLRREGDRYYAIDRPLRPTEGMKREQMVFSRDEGRKVIAEMELIRVLRRHRAKLVDPQFKLPLVDRRKLLTWLNAADNFAPEDTQP